VGTLASERARCATPKGGSDQQRELSDVDRNGGRAWRRCRCRASPRSARIKRKPSPICSDIVRRGLLLRAQMARLGDCAIANRLREKAAGCGRSRDDRSLTTAAVLSSERRCADTLHLRGRRGGDADDQRHQECQNACHDADPLCHVETEWQEFRQRPELQTWWFLRRSTDLRGLSYRGLEDFFGPVRNNPRAVEPIIAGDSPTSQNVRLSEVRGPQRMALELLM
jgi:hypothetical protein